MDRSLKWAVAIVITLILVLFPVFFQGCGATEWNPKGGNGQDTMLTLTRTDNGKSITMQVNDLLVVSLDENPTTGFQWAVDGGGSDLVKLQASDYIPAIESRVGGGGQRVLTFKAQRAGIDQLRLKLWREWQGEPSIVERFTVTLQVRE
ncbi:protease inhibitor I42 family protein [Microcystis aeruginosa CS-563/04]|uniref:protease inhibitor I42 family protein n=1 Tax=Microcystis aeruginosa TaxID=1126 RepID=UPI002330EF62|nr:protease inhibitor I42 family protein [Microcystis aeruginosa]MDB9419946.1 protease inhibitor I42 family protein [Microcystis aeruginosa CS-563/04]